MKESCILKKNPDIVSRTIDDEIILMPIYKSSDEINCIYTLNDAGSRIWQLIDGRRSVAKIRTMLFKEFEATEKQMDSELSKFLGELKQIKAITIK